MDPQIAHIEAEIVRLRSRADLNTDELSRLRQDTCVAAAELSRRVDRLERQLQSVRDARFYTWSLVAGYALAAVIFGLLWARARWL